MTLIELKQVSKKFKSNILFDNVSASFQKGAITGIIGANGSGKSILFKMICGFIQPDNGIIKIDSRYLEPKQQFPKNFGIIIERPGFIENISGFENLKRLAQIQKLISTNQIKESMLKVGLEPSNIQKVKNYSMGMKQKLAIAQAIMENQEVLILDEPFNALDSDSVNAIRELLFKYKEQGRTIILTSHNQEDIHILCDTVYKIEEKQLKKL